MNNDMNMNENEDLSARQLEAMGRLKEVFDSLPEAIKAEDANANSRRARFLAGARALLDAIENEPDADAAPSVALHVTLGDDVGSVGFASSYDVARMALATLGRLAEDGNKLPVLLSIRKLLDYIKSLPD